MRAVGIDPGPNGGALAAVLDDWVLLASWTRRARGVAVASRWFDRGVLRSTDEWTVADGVAALASIRAGYLPTHAAVERITHHRGKGSGLVALAEHAGACVAWCHERGVIPARPMPSTWRRDVLGLAPSTTADVCDAVAIYAVTGREYPERRKGAPLPMRVEAEVNAHEADAICLAIWAGGWRVSDGLRK